MSIPARHWAQALGTEQYLVLSPRQWSLSLISSQGQTAREWDQCVHSKSCTMVSSLWRCLAYTFNVACVLMNYLDLPVKQSNGKWWTIWICLLNKAMGSEQTPGHAKGFHAARSHSLCVFWERWCLKRTRQLVLIPSRCGGRQRERLYKSQPALKLKEVMFYRRFRRMWIQTVPERKKKKAMEMYNLGRGISPAER